MRSSRPDRTDAKQARLHQLHRCHQSLQGYRDSKQELRRQLIEVSSVCGGGVLPVVCTGEQNIHTFADIGNCSVVGVIRNHTLDTLPDPLSPTCQAL